ncbi:hypothetical protein F2Q69_00014882 [Brassica cretica]|uniref:Uncharacterized protein n=1 Tax=Brassica cretica TaxID=69181 RepID=A0A8S9R914_BRACR|nr:hypothetical protein F2Q69_00014882 [Brassica cretica]
MEKPASRQIRPKKRKVGHKASRPRSGSGYPRIIEYRDGYPKSGYPETTNPDPDIKSTDPTDPDPDPDTLNFPDIRIRPRASYM